MAVAEHLELCFGHLTWGVSESTLLPACSLHGEAERDVLAVCCVHRRHFINAC